MKARKRGAAGSDIAVQRLDENRYVLNVDGIVWFQLPRSIRAIQTAPRSNQRAIP
jgi:hypothetical protein